MDDNEPAPTYHRWVPDLPDGIYTNPVLGELRPGRSVEVRAQDAHIVAGSDWEKATAKQFEKQPSITDERAALNGLAEEE